MPEPVVPYGERIVRLETELREAREDIRALTEKVDMLVAAFHQLTGGKKAALAIYAAICAAGGILGSWILKKLGVPV